MCFLSMVLDRLQIWLSDNRRGVIGGVAHHLPRICSRGKTVAKLCVP